MNVRRIAAIVTVCLGVGSAAHTPAQTPNLSRTQRDLHAALLTAVDDAAKADESDDASVRTHVLRASDGSHYVAISAEPPASVTMPTRPMPVYIRLASAPPVAAQRPERSPTREWLVGQQTTPPPISRSGIALGDMPFLEFVMDDTGIGGVAVLYTITGKALHDVSDRDRVWLLNVMRLRSHPPRRQRRQRSVGRAQQPRHHLSRQAARDPEPPFSPRTSTNGFAAGATIVLPIAAARARASAVSSVMTVAPAAAAGCAHAGELPIAISTVTCRMAMTLANASKNSLHAVLKLFLAARAGTDVREIDILGGMVLLTGATGYVGGRLLRALVARGEAVRCLVRDAARVAARLVPGVDVVTGDVTDRAALDAALKGITTAYYLVHSMGEASGFEEREQAGARNFAEAAARAGVRRIIYLGGLGDDRIELSPHLRSRHEVGRILRDSGVPTCEFRASIVIGSGSLSFELVRALTEHLPVMVTPRWVSIQAQPIGIQDLIAYLLEALDVPLERSVVVEIGGPDRVSYLGLMQEYGRQRGLRRLMIPVPLLTPTLSSWWLGLVTPLYARVGRKLIESIKHPTVVTTDTAARLFSVRPIGVAEAIQAALENEDREYAETRWIDAASASGVIQAGAPQSAGRRRTDVRAVDVAATPADCFAIVSELGGETGWPPYTWLWRLRGAMDLLAGGVGMRRGRPQGRPLRAGDAVDFWRVEVCEPDGRLRLVAEMKLPGRAWLEYHVASSGSASVIRQTATFDPMGLAGLLYWYALVPAHALIFPGMLRAIAARARAKREPS
jgi:uncharacterized protein YbjT (DUF2867 family)